MRRFANFGNFETRLESHLYRLGKIVYVARVRIQRAIL